VTLGIYEDDGLGSPGVLLLDAGTIDGNSATAQEKTISQALVGGRRYHLAALVDGGTPTLRVITPAAGTFIGRISTLAAATGVTATQNGRTRTGIAGFALPNPAATTGPTTIPIAIAVRLA
jgi:hypothetical protein